MSRRQGGRRRKNTLRRIILFVTFAAVAVIIIALGRTTVEKAIYPMEYSNTVRDCAQKYGLDEALIYGVIKTESRFDPQAVSHAGAMGLMQITRDTYFFVNEKDKRGDLPVELLFDPEVNIDTGCYFLSWLIRDLGDVDTAIAAYNAGRGNVRKWLTDERYSEDGATLYDIPFNETKNYVKKVNGAYQMYRELYFS